MVTVSSTEKGFTLIELLLSLMVITGMLLIGLNFAHEFRLDHYYFLSEYNLIQSEAMLKRQSRVYEHGVSFNSMGHVFQGKTIPFSRHEVVVHLGNGYAFIR